MGKEHNQPVAYYITYKQMGCSAVDPGSKPKVYPPACACT